MSGLSLCSFITHSRFSRMCEYSVLSTHPCKFRKVQAREASSLGGSWATNEFSSGSKQDAKDSQMLTRFFVLFLGSFVFFFLSRHFNVWSLPFCSLDTSHHKPYSLHGVSSIAMHMFQRCNTQKRKEKTTEKQSFLAQNTQKASSSRTLLPGQKWRHLREENFQWKTKRIFFVFLNFQKAKRN